jgi:aminoglycoside phosphotransferase (APT) family kinase protein
LTSVPAADLRNAWRSAGEAMRMAHEIVLPQAGEIIRDQIEPFADGWAHYILEDIATDIAWLLDALNAPKVDLALLERVTAASIAALTGAPVRLIHDDALPQNILVNQEPDGWVCTGWLDWEFARAGDPLWDLSTLDFRPAGLVPASFYEGYGAQPAEPQTGIYDLLMATWRTRAELEHGSHWNWPPQPARIAYLRTLPAQIERLAASLGV